MRFLFTACTLDWEETCGSPFLGCHKKVAPVLFLTGSFGASTPQCFQLKNGECSALPASIYSLFLGCSMSASAPEGNPRLSDYNSWAPVWSREQHQRGRLSGWRFWDSIQREPATHSSAPPELMADGGTCISLLCKKTHKRKLGFFEPAKWSSQQRDFIGKLLLTLIPAKFKDWAEGGGSPSTYLFASVRF